MITKGWMYILECADGSYYTGSSNNLEKRFAQHQQGTGANYTKRRLPVKLVYSEEFARVDDAFYREKQVQGWSRVKKEALINGRFDDLPGLSRASIDSATMTTSVPELHSTELTEDVEGMVPELVEGKGL